MIYLVEEVALIELNGIKEENKLKFLLGFDRDLYQKIRLKRDSMGYK